MKISAVIISYNEEANIGRCIDSLLSVADEIIVVDSFSTDRTREICIERGVRFIQNQFKGHIQQKNFALMQAQNDFVLALDADEFLSEELIVSIREVKLDSTHQAYSMNRLSSYQGKWIHVTDWYPDRKLRLWNKNIGTWGGINPHDKVVLNQRLRVKHLNGVILHHAYANVNELLEKAHKYSSIFAEEMRYRLSSSTFKIIYKSIFTFFRNYFFKFGFLRGYEGLVISYTNATYTFYKYAKLREFNRGLTTSLVITTYNREDALELTLLGVLKQSEMPDEIIVADDGSRPSTKELVDRYREIFPIPLLHCWHEDIGFRLSTIRNKAITIASGEYIIMIDGDIIMHKDFIRSHKQNAWAGQFIQGSRVLLQPHLTQQSLMRKDIDFHFFQSGIRNRFNTIYSPILSKLVSHYGIKPDRIRGANLSFWRKDVLLVNGFNEDFVGWGREDSEFAVRMHNMGISRLHLKFMAFGYHLFHKESPRDSLKKNDQILEQAITQKLTSCENGINKYLLKRSIVAA
jgi:glycosyltransferase involved in cell wall biosynthesis